MLAHDLAYWLALNEYPKFGPKSMTRLIASFPSMKDAFYANSNDLISCGIPPKTAEGFIFFREDINPDKILQQVYNHNFTPITIKDDNYPTLLKQIYDPPAVLYVWGKLPQSDIVHLGVVGSRKASQYGKQVTKELITKIAEKGVVIVSGLAYGIDEHAHIATVNAHGTTIAVLASGLLQLNSRQRYLAKKIVDNGGAVISEFSINTHALKHFFPYRNRVISGLSHGTLIIEAAEKSGSLITAKSALEQNREVFAVPGSIYSETSIGTNNLIKTGAHAVINEKDVLDILEVGYTENKPKEEYKADTKEELAIINLLSKNPIHIDEIIRSTKLDSNTVASTLSIIEIKGHTRQIGGMYYILV